MEASSPGS